MKPELFRLNWSLLFAALLLGSTSPAGRAEVSSMYVLGQITVTSDDASDEILIGLSNGFFYVAANGVPEPMSGIVGAGRVDTIIVNGGGGDDRLTLTHDGGLMAGANGVTFIGGSGSDSLELVGDPNASPLTRETYVAGPALGEGAQDGLVVFDPNDSLGPGLFGAYDGDEEIVRFFDLVPVMDAVPMQRLEVWLTDGADTVHVVDGPGLQGTASTKVHDGGAGLFPSIEFAHKTAVVLNGRAGADTIVVDHPNPAADLSSLDIYAHEVTGGFVVSEDHAADRFEVYAVPGAVPLHAYGQGGNDSLYAGSPSGVMDATTGVFLHGDEGEDSLTLDDDGRAGGLAYALDEEGVVRSDGVEIHAATVENCELRTGTGPDTVEVDPSSSVAFEVDGGTAVPGGVLTVETEGLSASVVAGTVTVSGRAPVTTRDFDRVRVLGSPTDLVLSQADDVDPVEDGRNVTYMLSISNAGLSVATGVVVTNPIPDETAVWAVGSGCVADDDAVVCFAPAMNAGAVLTFPLTLRVLNFAGLEITNAAVTVYDEEDVRPGDNATAETTAVLKHAPGDFDGDERSDLTVMDMTTYTWLTLAAGGSLPAQQYGAEGFLPVPADYDGDGEVDYAVYEQVTGNWYLLMSSDGFEVQQWGWSAALPVPADYDGDGRADVTVYHPASGAWYIRQSKNGVLYYQQWGWSAAVPVPADYDGDGEVDMTVYHPAEGMWYILQSSNDTLYQQQWGWSPAIPAPGDFDRDGEVDMTVYHPADGMWYVLQSSDGALFQQQWGWSAAWPAPADYDGDRTADIAVYSSDDGAWYIRQSSNLVLRQEAWGSAGAIPLHGQYLVNRLYGLVP